MLFAHCARQGARTGSPLLLVFSAPARSRWVPMRIIFADDHFLVRATLKTLLTKLGPAGEVRVDELAGLFEVMESAALPPEPALILLDLSMPGMRGATSISSVRDVAPRTPIVILSGHSDHDTMLECFKYGAAGFIPKTTGGSEMLGALRLVLEGQRYIPPSFVDQELVSPNTTSAAPQTFTDDLTERERTLLKHLALGKKNKEIARAFGLEEVTIKFAMRRLYKKMNATNRASAVSLAIKAGIV